MNSAIVVIPPVTKENMMLTIRRSNDRGLADHGWLHSRHTFSFSSYYDPRFMGFRALRVINEDRVEPGKGFGTHPHRDMEIISYVLDGGLEHADSMGNSSVIYPGDVQRMSAGTGVTHSEYNHSKTEPVHFLQIWIEPAQRSLAPSYEQKTFSEGDKQNTLRLIASADGRDGSVVIHQDAAVYASLLSPGAAVTFACPEKRHVWLQVARGKVRVNDADLAAGDGLCTSDESELRITGVDSAEFLLFDLA